MHEHEELSEDQLQAAQQRIAAMHLDQPKQSKTQKAVRDTITIDLSDDNQLSAEIAQLAKQDDRTRAKWVLRFLQDAMAHGSLETPRPE